MTPALGPSGRAVAVLLGQDQYLLLSSPAEDWLACTLALRNQAQALGLQLMTAAELLGLREQSSRSSRAVSCVKR